MSPYVEEVAGVQVPRGPTAQATEAAVREVMPPALFNNGVRTYLYGSMIARQGGIDHDSELFYVGALMHNLGLVAPYADERRFEVSGADAGRDFALKHGMPAEKAQVVWDTVALHTSLGIASARGGEVALVHLGTSADVVGIGVDEFPEGFVDAVLREYPRLGFKQELLRSLISAAERSPEAYALTFMADTIRERKMAPLPTFEQLLVGAPFDE